MRSRVFALFCMVFVSLGSVVYADFDKGLKAFEAGDMETAVSEWQMASDQGNAEAQFRLGKLYEEGRGVPQDFIEAHKWYNLSAAQGNEEARKARDAVSKKMTKEELAEARKLARDWKPAKAIPPPVTPVQVPVQEEKTEKPVSSEVPQSIVVDVQRMLTEQGFDPGPADGAPGRRTIAAVEAFQEREGMQVDGKITRELVKRLYRAILQEKATTRKAVQLLKAAKKGDIKNIKRLIEDGAKVNFQDNDGWTPLLYASAGGHIEAVKLLIESKADVNISEKNGNTPLMAAVISGDQALMDLLINKGANLNTTNTQGVPLVNMARIKGNTAFVNRFKDAGYREPFINTIGMTFVYIPPGTFMMGSPPTEKGTFKDIWKLTPHRVTLSKGFYMQNTEVTQAQWKAIMGNNPSEHKECGDNCPVENVSWYSAQYFIRKLNGREGVNLYRLPTEAEWEYACRAGTSTRFFFGNDEKDLKSYDWYGENASSKYENRSHPVGRKMANPWGLYDMYGNVYEWCQDCAAEWGDEYDAGEVVDPVGPTSGSYRVTRGSAFLNEAKHIASAKRGMRYPDLVASTYGFRVVKDLIEKPSGPSGYKKLNASVESFKFYEEGYESLPRDQRIYTNRFDREKTRYVFWELHTKFPKQSNRTDFKLDVLWIKQDGNIFASQEYKSYAPAGWTGAIYDSSKGWKDPGHWKPGSYRVEVYDGVNMIAEGSFEIY